MPSVRLLPRVEVLTHLNWPWTNELFDLTASLLKMQCLVSEQGNVFVVWARTMFCSFPQQRQQCLVSERWHCLVFEQPQGYVFEFQQCLVSNEANNLSLAQNHVVSNRWATHFQNQTLACFQNTQHLFERRTHVCSKQNNNLLRCKWLPSSMRRLCFQNIHQSIST